MNTKQTTNRLSSTNLGSEYSDDEREFLTAMERYMQEHRVRYPSFTEVLNVAKSLGYKKARREGE